MENNKINEESDGKISVHPVENDYEKHKSNPGPAPSAINEDDDKGVGFTLIWILAVMFIVLIIAWFFFFRDVP